jgi:hypothetical protein
MTLQRSEMLQGRKNASEREGCPTPLKVFAPRGSRAITLETAGSARAGCSKRVECKAPEIPGRISLPNLTSAGARPGVPRGAIRKRFRTPGSSVSEGEERKRFRDGGSPRGSPRAKTLTENRSDLFLLHKKKI